MLVLGIAGTAKNTGKTTTTVSIINHWSNPRSLAVTSIGYDGESKDNVTGLPKPRLNMPAGALVVTAERCLAAGSARIETLEKTEISTPLGRLVVGRILKAGLVVMAGPNNEKALRHFITRLKEMEAGLLLVDGALGRLAPMAAADGLVLATGAARTRDLDRLALETAAFADIFSLPPVTSVAEPVCELSSLLVEKQGQAAAAQANGANTVEFTGVVDAKPLAEFMEHLGTSAPDLIFRDPVKLLLAQDLVQTAVHIKGYIQKGAGVMVRKLLPLKAVTVNPFFPEYNEANRQYAPGYVDADQIYEAIANSISAPAVDVVRQGEAELARILGLN